MRATETGQDTKDMSGSDRCEIRVRLGVVIVIVKVGSEGS